MNVSRQLLSDEAKPWALKEVMSSITKGSEKRKASFIFLEVAGLFYFKQGIQDTHLPIILRGRALMIFGPLIEYEPEIALHIL